MVGSLRVMERGCQCIEQHPGMRDLGQGVFGQARTRVRERGDRQPGPAVADSRSPAAAPI